MAIDLANKPYSSSQVTKSVWDQNNNRLRVDAVVTATIGELAVDLDQSDDSVAIGDGTNIVSVNADGALSVEFNESEVLFEYDSASVGISSTVVILTKTFNQTKKIKSAILSGDNLGKYTIYLNGNEISKLRTTWDNYNLEVALNDLKVINGDVLQVEVTNNNSSVADFNATIIYQKVG